MLKKEKLRLRHKRTLLLKKLSKVEDFTRGSVVLMKRRCYRPNCRKCASGEAHPTWVLTVSTGGKTRTVYLGDKRVDEAKRMVENYRTMQTWMEEIARINLALLTDKPLQNKGAADE